VQADAAGEEDKIGPLDCFGILFTKIENKGLGKIFLAIAVQSLHGHLDVDLFLAAVEADDAQAKVQRLSRWAVCRGGELPVSVVKEFQVHDLELRLVARHLSLEGSRFLGQIVRYRHGDSILAYRHLFRHAQMNKGKKRIAPQMQDSAGGKGSLVKRIAFSVSPFQRDGRVHFSGGIGLQPRDRKAQEYTVNGI